MEKEILDYFNGDELAASVWDKKYRFKDEQTPADSFKRYCKEIAEKEIQRTKNISLYQEVDDKLSDFGKARWYNVISKAKCGPEQAQFLMQDYFKQYINFDNIILGGSMLATIGNHESYSSLSNCFVLGQPYDSYAGINQKTMEMCEVMKRRMGSGIDISSLRPDGAIVHNQSTESCGPILFANRYSFVSSEIAQRGRRGALMISMQVAHPNAEDFVLSKQDLTKITGANISIILDDKFMQAVVSQTNNTYYQHFPTNVPIDLFKVAGQNQEWFDSLQEGIMVPAAYIESQFSSISKQGYIRKINAKKLWNKIIHCAWATAEPGVIFGDNWNEYGTDGVYTRYAAITCNPCSEIPMQAYDSCRLASINLFSFVNNPFTKEAEFDFERFYRTAYEQVCILDTLVDLEADYIQRIIEKIQSDNDEPQELKDQAINLWKRVLEEGQAGRRLGAGFTGLGDTLAALNLKYKDSDNTVWFLIELFKTKMRGELDATTDLSVLFGTFDGFDANLEKNDSNNQPFGANRIFKTIMREFPEQWERMKLYGRRNVSWSTAAPTGSLSILTQTTSGIEPLFMPFYKRRKKVMKHDERVDYIDPADGQKFTEFFVLHPKFKTWLNMQGISHEALSENQLQELFKQSPWFESCANDIPWYDRVIIQGIVQRYTTHSISSTINLPNDIDESVISNIYMQSWSEGLKGNTVYRDGSRGGVLVSVSNKNENENNFYETKAPKRPQTLPARYHTLRYKNRVYSVIIGLLENKPYEVFIASGVDGLPENLDEFEDVIEGEIVKEGKDWYNFECDGFILKDIADTEDEEKTISLMLSMALRHRTPLKYIIKTLEKTRPIAGSFTHRLIKILYHYISQEEINEISSDKCPECGGRIIKENGCMRCIDCGYSKCS